MHKKSQGFAILESLLGLLAATLIVGIGWYVYSAANRTDNTNANSEAASNSIQKTNQASPTPPDSTPTPKPEAEIDTSKWLTYKNDSLGFSFSYPDSWGEIDVRFNEATFFLALWNTPDKELSIELRGEPSGTTNSNHGYFARGFTLSNGVYAVNTNSEPEPIAAEDLFYVNQDKTVLVAAEKVVMTGYIDLNGMANLQNKQVAGVKLNFRRWSDPNNGWAPNERMYTQDDVLLMTKIMSTFTLF